ncbi:MAG: hypothetical protein LKF37_02215 [Lentilactobacillus diolivorans]|jgi:ribonuclease D|nr:hypothetical protein [Lentilactobacillus diolivorans]
MVEHLKNWREQQGTELDKAKKLIQSNANMAEVSRQTGISTVSLSAYRKGDTDITKAKWTTINKLAQVWDIRQITPNISTSKFLNYVDDLDDWFDEAKQLDPRDPMHDVISALSSMVKSDPVMMFELYKFYDESKMDK